MVKLLLLFVIRFYHFILSFISLNLYNILSSVFGIQLFSYFVHGKPSA